MIGGEENIAGTNGQADAVAGRGVAQGHLDVIDCVAQTYTHNAVGRTRLGDDSGQQVFETGGLRKAFAFWRIQNLWRSSLTHDSAVIHSDHALAERVNLIAAVRDVQDGNFLRSVPGTEVVNDRRFQ